MFPCFPRLFFARLALAGLCLGLGEGSIFARVEGGKGGKTAPAASVAPVPTVAPTSEEKATPAPVIPPTRAEPVVPPSAAKSIASQLNDAYVSVFEHVAPAVVVIDVLKRADPDGEGEFLPDLFFPSPAPDGKGGAGPKEKDKPKAEGKEKGAKPEETPRPPAARRPLSSSEGSGFIIQPSGFILTNNHVISGAEKIDVRLKDGRQFRGRVVGADKDTDIAVVKIDAADLPTAELANSDTLRVGQIACAIGVPYNQDYSFTAGVVSAKNRYKLTPDDIGYDDYIQTDASINPGNSGGPLVDLDGKVIGMNTLINGFNRGLGFAIPSNMLREVGDQLIRSGRVVRSYLGVRIESLGSAIERYGAVFGPIKRGVVVQMIQPDSPAMRSGELRPSDIITEVDGVSVGSDRELQKQIIAKKIGSSVQLTVVRRSKTLKVVVTTAELPAEPAPVFGRRESEDPDTPPGDPVPVGPTPVPSPSRNGGTGNENPAAYGLQLQEVTRDIAAGMNLGPGASGVLVTAVQDDSAAEKAGLAVKDVITSVDDRPVRDLATFRDALKQADARRGVMCYVDRLGAKSFVVLKAE